MTAITLNDLYTILPELVLVVMGMVLMLIGALRHDGGRGVVHLLSLLSVVLALAMVPIAGGLLGGHGGGHGPVTAFNGLVGQDAVSMFAEVLILIASFVALVMARGYLVRVEDDHFEFPVLVLFATAGMMIMVSATDLITVYVGLELQSLALYVLAAYHRDSVRSTEAGLKYFVLGALASGLLLYGMSLLYGTVGNTSFTALAEVLGQGDHAPSLGLILGMVFLLTGLGFKVSAAPFHMWTPDVYEGAPTPVTAFFSAGPKIAAIVLMVQVMMGPLQHQAPEWSQMVAILSVLSMVVGAFAALRQTNIKRLLAYSSIGHVGYALIGLAVADTAGVRGILIYMAIYMVMSLGTFAVVLSMRIKDQMVEDIDDLRGLAKTHPLMALAMAIFMFSMAGIPPMAGFFAKLYIFMAAIESQAYTLAILGVLTSVVAAFYYLRIIKVMYFDDVVTPLDRPVSNELGAVLGVGALLVVLFFLVPAPLVDGAGRAAAALVGHG